MKKNKKLKQLRKEYIIFFLRSSLPDAYKILMMNPVVTTEAAIAPPITLPLGA